ncbi:MAG TPA: riboflavin synthase [Firmicutes bacterium]|nr:riboflavin synthase [Bacillota bacterium]
MFTGIIEEKGIVKSITLRGESGFLEIQCQKVLEDTKLGDSIAVNGACLTVTSLEQDAFTADVMAETLRRTSLKELKKGSFVNLERALQIGHRLGGHMVSGHVDGIGIIRKLEPQGIAMVMTISTKSSITEGIIEKGSVAIDGISLTVVSVEEEAFSVSLIPHTIQETNLAHKKPGSTVNLETDMIGKYVKKFLTSETCDSDSLITMDLLAENGFLL